MTRSVHRYSSRWTAKVKGSPVYGRLKVSAFYWMPVSGLTYAVVGGWRPWVYWAVPFVVAEVVAAVANWLRAD
jgi:hypothetical protein